MKKRSKRIEPAKARKAAGIVDAAKLSRDAPATTTDNSNIVSADAVDLSYTADH